MTPETYFTGHRLLHDEELPESQLAYVTQHFHDPAQRMDINEIVAMCQDAYDLLWLQNKPVNRRVVAAFNHLSEMGMCHSTGRKLQ